MGEYFLDKEGRFIIEDYNTKYPFSNFLPGISGIWGIPLWVFYVNRGQGVISMGIKDKNHAFLEFVPANRAYQSAPLLGFRTFVKINNGQVYEPFKLGQGRSRRERMVITSYDVSFQEKNFYKGLEFLVNYFTLPNMPMGALVRTLTIKNTSREEMNMDVLDGVPKIIPFGSRDLFLKYLSRTLEAWMTSDIKKICGKDTALFKLAVDPEDAASTQHIEGVNFAFSFYEKDSRLVPSEMIVDPQLVFAQDTSFEYPVNFIKKEFAYSKNQVMRGKTPCVFSFSKIFLSPGEECIFYTLLGGVFHEDILKNNAKVITAGFLEKKREENKNLIERLKENALCVSGSHEFNEYIKNSYLDNILRGGYPYTTQEKRAYYVFYRKHGDLERDYNKFKFLPSYFSEGESNYRDVNQNRRMDLFFEPALFHKNIVLFMNLLRMDGYNPLLIRGEKYYFERNSQIKAVLQKARLPMDGEVVKMMKKGFYLGEFFALLERKQIKVHNRERVVDLLLNEAQGELQAKFGEGFWIDHWHYNLDLIESFLYFYPDRKEELFLRTEFMFWDDASRVAKRTERFCFQKGKLSQLNAVVEIPKKREMVAHRARFKNFLRVDDGKGKIYKTHCLEKLLSLLLNKVATFDFKGVGIEMEAGKPGWCDSLNGLPALIGSSLCETLELKRLTRMLKEVFSELHTKQDEISLCEELRDFFLAAEGLLIQFFKKSSKERDLWWWDNAGAVKEKFRDTVFWGVRGKQKTVSFSRIEAFLTLVIKKLDAGIKKAEDKSSGVCLTYFRHEVKGYSTDKSEALKLSKIKSIPLPLSLEGPVHALRIQKQKELHEKVKRSDLFDKKLNMYRLNTCLESAPLEIGRSRVFPRGWLENESVWLHMEYKYLLEILKNGMYEEFYKNFYTCGICFLNPEKYGRSVLENSSFIVSSVYPDKSLWGKGFVARLTGATSEIINIWILMCLGKEPFFLNEAGELCVRFVPILEARFFTRKPYICKINGKERKLPVNTFAFKLFSKTLIVYHNPHRKNTYAKDVQTRKIEVYESKKKTVVKGPVLLSEFAYKLREQKIDEVHVYLK